MRELVISSAERLRIADALRDFGAAAVTAHKWSGDCVHRLAHALDQAWDEPGLVIRGLPRHPRDITGWPDSSASKADTQTVWRNATLLYAAKVLGELFAFDAEQEGALYQDVRPRPGSEDVASSASHAQVLALHSEVAFHPVSPDFILLLCVRQSDPPAPTMISDARDAAMKLRPHDQSALRRPLYAFRAPASFSMGDDYFPPQPIVTGPPDAPHVRINLNPGHTRTSDSDGARALTALSERLHTGAFPVTLAPGDLLVINNKAAAHGRPPFARAADGQDRWLRRVYIKRDLWKPGSGVRPQVRVVPASI